MKTMNQFWTTLKTRWQNAMPVFFRRVCWICSLVSGTAIAAHTAMQTTGSQVPEWWNDIYPYLVGITAGMAFAAKFTQNYDRAGNPIKKLPENSNS